MTVPVRRDVRADELREQARAAATPVQALWLVAIAQVLGGDSREDEALSTSMDLQILLYWVHSRQDGRAAGLLYRKAAGLKRRVSLEQLD